jgi:hypothetical protein
LLFYFILFFFHPTSSFSFLFSVDLIGNKINKHLKEKRKKEEEDYS